MSAKNTREETTVKLYDLKVNYQKNSMGIPEENWHGKWLALKSPSIFSGIYDGFKKCFKECPGKYLPSIYFGVKILQMC